ncbi:flagellar hook-associated protein FlgK [Wansuia hejianensis]|uniref:Flagellar hook-associated protein 1 n=1 Tax=Wansuia hejianensis TaxID=2763667 RepID=A0A926IM76_9FIRM|nr:flagellar hook-associated protein FlgK [Wansuia hejianensis]MBC8590326.1 flagellar hook-associated protein FlgK [Wansuia hejianensis]
MSGLFNTLNTANKGLMASQTALHTTGHNISNANTPGFSRQRVEMKADLAFNYAGVGQLGTGVKMESVIRMVNDYVSKQIRQENSTLQEFASKAEVMEQLEVIFNEPSDTSLNTDIGKMFDSWVELSKNPEMLTSKTIVVERSKTLADTFNHMMTQIDALEAETTGMIEKNVTDFNATIDKLESLNRQIFNVAVKGNVPNDLLDQRDLLLQDLSSMANIDAEFDQYSRVSVGIGGEKDNLLKAGESAKHLGYSEEVGIVLTDKDGKLVDKDGNPIKTENEDIVKIKIGSGEIKGRLSALEDIEGRRNELANFGITMARAINKVHTSEDGGPYIFGFDTKTKTLKVNEVLLKDPSLIQAGKGKVSSEENEDGSPVGDGSRALLISRLRNAKINFSANPTFDDGFIDLDNLTLKDQDGGNTIGGYYNNIVTSVGISKEHADNMVANQEVLMGQLDLRRESVSGVHFDEEISNLIKFQSAYSANARVISVLTEMLDTLINRTGV